jgi:hypothetical protein
MRTFVKSLVVLATMLLAGTATAVSMDVIIIGPAEYVPSSAVPSDMITVEISLDSGIEAQNVHAYFMSITWTGFVDGEPDTLALAGVVAGSEWLPNFGESEFWAHLSGNLAVDAYGLELNGQDAGGKTNYRVFDNDVLGTLVFHVIAPGEAIVTPYYGLGDVILDEGYLAIPGVELNAAIIHTPEPAIGALALAAIATLGVLVRRRHR